MVASTRSSLAAVVLLVGSSIAQTPSPNNCSVNSFFGSGYNASGSVIVPGFRVNDSYPETTWTWTRYVADVPDSQPNVRNVHETIGLKTSPLLNLLDPNTPYTGCVIALTGITSSVAKRGAKDDGSCSSLFGSDCLNEIINAMNETATSLSGTPAGSAYPFSCPQLMQSVTSNSKSKCDPTLFTESISSEFLPNNFTSRITPNRTCPIVNPGDSNVANGSFFSWGHSDDTGNYTRYDDAIQYPTPILVSVWLKATQNVSSATTVSFDTWADTRVMCLPANVTQPGSRNITEVEKKGAAASITSTSMGLFGVVGLTALLGLVI